MTYNTYPLYVVFACVAIIFLVNFYLLSVELINFSIRRMLLLPITPFFWPVISVSKLTFYLFSLIKPFFYFHNLKKLTG